MFPALFDDEDGGEPGIIQRDFTLNFGWIYSATLVAEMERISLEQTWDLPVIQFLNDLTYIKKKRELDREMEREALKKAKRHGKT